MPSRHSTIVGGSSAARVINCPGSTALLAQLPDVVDRDSYYSIEGTALHKLMQQLIVGKVKIKKLPATMKIDDTIVPITQALIADCIVPAWDYWLDFKKKIDKYFLEIKVEFPGIVGAFGTADIIGRNEKHNITYITDWKFGAGEGVKAVYPDDTPFFEIVNEQLLYYAAAARNTKPKLFPPGCKIVLTIVQPRARGQEPITTAEVTLEDLDAFEQEMRAAVIQASGTGAPTKKGRWCRFQACQTVCPHHTGPLLDLNAIAVTLPINELKTVKEASAALTVIDPKTSQLEKAPLSLLDILNAAATVEAVIREARAQAHLILGNGGEVPGWKLVAKRGTRQWTVDEKTLLKKLKLKKNQLYETTLKSPAGVEKVIGKKNIPEGLTTVVSSGTTIAPIADKRPAISGDPNAVSQILLEVLPRDE